jgi:hypothetical protein
VTKLKAAGIPGEDFRKLTGYTKIVDTLNGEGKGGCSNPITAWATIAKNNPRLGLTMPVASGSHTGSDSDWISASNQQVLREMRALDALSPEEKEARLPLNDRVQILKKRMYAAGHNADEVVTACAALR